MKREAGCLLGAWMMPRSLSSPLVFSDLSASHHRHVRTSPFVSSASCLSSPGGAGAAGPVVCPSLELPTIIIPPGSTNTMLTHFPQPHTSHTNRQHMALRKLLRRGAAVVTVASPAWQRCVACPVVALVRERGRGGQGRGRGRGA